MENNRTLWNWVRDYTIITTTATIITITTNITTIRSTTTATNPTTFNSGGGCGDISSNSSFSTVSL
jgi:hypothetical protein